MIVFRCFPRICIPIEPEHASSIIPAPEFDLYFDYVRVRFVQSNSSRVIRLHFKKKKKKLKCQTPYLSVKNNPQREQITTYRFNGLATITMASRNSYFATLLCNLLLLQRLLVEKSFLKSLENGTIKNETK